jgi:PTH2 family peptidyl-tRNA hydrolase
MEDKNNDIINNDIKQVIVMRKDLHMRSGKIAAQAAHASLKVFFDMMQIEYGLNTVKNGDAYKYALCLPKGEIGDDMYKWINGIFKKIVVGVDNIADVVNSYEEAKRLGLPCSLICDLGLTEFGGERTITCCAIGPAHNNKIDKITGKFNLL